MRRVYPVTMQHPEPDMNTYGPTPLYRKIAIAVITIALGFGVLELVAGGMPHPDPATMAARQQFLAMEAERAQQIRDLDRGQVRYAESAPVAIH